MKLIVQDIEKAFGEKKVLQKACASFESGKIYGLLGRNGAVKQSRSWGQTVRARPLCFA